MSAQGPETVKPSIPAPDAHDGKPTTLRSWLLSLELYFAACKLDKDVKDQASLLQGSALAWYHSSCMRTTGSMLKAYADL